MTRGMKAWTVVLLALLVVVDGVFMDPATIAYCNPDPYQDKKIPPIPLNVVVKKGLKIRQAQVVARHGSRTPYVDYQCWSGYGFKWDCNVTDMSLPSPTPDGDGRTTAWLFRKVYDGHTVLGGTCHLGQLVHGGFKQEAANGKILKDAYVGLGEMKLFMVDYLTRVNEKFIYLRSDDDPSYRTEMSGEVLVSGMFDGSIPLNLDLHTSDYALDDIYPNKRVCPALSEIAAQAWASPEWQQYLDSKEVKELNDVMSKALPGYTWDHMLDCLMTTACTGKPFPDTLTEEIFKAAEDYSVKLETFPFSWNSSYYSKLAMGPLALTLLESLENRAHGNSETKFALYLGHDTTILPLLAALGVWDGKWPTYASYISLELYESNEGPLFRLIYAGKELLLEGCVEALCSITVLQDNILSWALPYDNRPCGKPLPIIPAASGARASAKQQVVATKQRWIASPSAIVDSSDSSSSSPSPHALLSAIIVSTVAGIVLGVFGVALYTGWHRRRHFQPVSSEPSLHYGV